MLSNTTVIQKVIPSRRVLITGLIVFLGIALTAGFVRFQTAHVIAPPGLRLMNDLWTLFICRCPNFPDLLSF